MNVADVPPAEARARFRDGLVTPTAGWSRGWTQANLLAVPRDLAFDFLLFAQRNPKPCPLLDVTEPGEPASPRRSPGDIRTDVPAYRVYVDGELVEETDRRAARTGATTWCASSSAAAFTFEGALLAAGLPVRHIEEGVNVPMYRTTRPVPAGGRFGRADGGVDAAADAGAGQVADAMQVCLRFPRCTAPRSHVGDPAALGIATWDARTSATRSTCCPARCRCSGRAG